MTDTANYWTTEAIQSAASVLRRVRPAYAEMLDFYGPLFELQEGYRRRVNASLITLSEEMIAIKRQADLPLLSSSDFPIDHDNARQLLVEICRLAGEANPELAAAARQIEKSMEAGDFDVAPLFDDPGAQEKLTAAAEPIAVAPEMLSTLAYHAARPSILVAAEQLREISQKQGQWNKGYCPLCGSAPALALLDREGRKRVCCGFCWHEWRLPRLFCPSCETTDVKMLYYFYSQQEPEYRVDVCDSCGKYIKTVDTRHTSRTIYPALEAVATLHLDMKAQSPPQNGDREQ